MPRSNRLSYLAEREIVQAAIPASRGPRPWLASYAVMPSYKEPGSLTSGSRPFKRVHWSGASRTPLRDGAGVSSGPCAPCRYNFAYPHHAVREPAHATLSSGRTAGDARDRGAVVGAVDRDRCVGGGRLHDFPACV